MEKRQLQTKIKKVLICGGGRVAYYLAARLCKIGMHVKIIEKDENRCEELCDCLPKVTVIHGDATDHDLLVKRRGECRCICCADRNR